MLPEIQEMMDRMFSLRWPFSGTLRRFGDSSQGWAPQVDMYEEGDNIVIKAELPGVTKDDVEVALEADDLVIKGERKSEQVVDEQNYYRMERSFGSFYRRLPMPEGLEPDQISANFQDGVLEVQATKPPASKRSGKRIEIR
jgi:HSP20 family protein